MWKCPGVMKPLLLEARDVGRRNAPFHAIEGFHASPEAQSYLFATFERRGVPFLAWKEKKGTFAPPCGFPPKREGQKGRRMHAYRKEARNRVSMIIDAKSRSKSFSEQARRGVLQAACNLYPGVCRYVCGACWASHVSSNPCWV